LIPINARDRHDLAGGADAGFTGVWEAGDVTRVDFGQVVGMYLAALFIVRQVINFIAFRALPTMPIVVGGVLVIAGGAIITFWSAVRRPVEDLSRLHCRCRSLCR
jgi:hypothetical protein